VSDSKTSGAKEVAHSLRAVELFRNLSKESLLKVAKEGKVMTLGPGDVLFSPGDPADRIHLIRDGVIEITRATPEDPTPTPVAYLTAGELIGDMALLTGSPRRSGARVPESASLWTLTSAGFEVLAAEIPEYGMAIAKVFARRLENFIKHMRRQQARRKELAGHLEYFDMPTVVQTLVSSSQTGILTVTDSAGKPFAEVLLLEGAVKRARCAHLDGEEAFYEMFLGPEGGQFHFRTVADPDPEASGKTEITLSAMNLLMQAMKLVDELPETFSRLPDAELPLKATVKPRKLRWEDAETRGVAKRVLTALRSPTKIEDLTGKTPCSTYLVYKVVAELYETQQIAA